VTGLKFAAAAAAAIAGIVLASAVVWVGLMWLLSWMLSW
jgi:hypothetical protein